MFTGIIESFGRVANVRKTQAGLRIEIEFIKKVRGLKLGESVAVDGVCLTATQVTPQGFTADVVQETLKATTLGALKQDRQVHLERALKLGARLGGHIITGHVDGRGIVTRVTAEGQSKLIWLKVPVSAKDFCLTKGSIAVNGVSLTIQEISEGQVKIALVPHTLQETLLGKLSAKKWVNIEADALLRKPEVCAAQVITKRETAGSIKQRLIFLTRQGF